MKVHHVVITMVAVLLLSIFLLIGKEFKKDVNRFKDRHDKAERYFGKTIILKYDTLEILDYRLGQFMLEDRTWIHEDVVYRKVTE